MTRIRRQRGVALVAVIFLIVVIGAALTVMARLSVQSNAQVTQSLLQARAKQAASAGLEWASQRLVEDQACDYGPTPVAVAGFDDYTVTVECGAGDYNRPNQRITLYRMVAVASTGAPNDPDYAWTRLEAAIEL